MSTALMTLPEFARYIGIATPTLARAFAAGDRWRVCRCRRRWMMHR